MQKIIFLAVLCLYTTFCHAQSTPLSGKVVEQGESNTPLANVQITAQGANNEVSKTNGSFALQYAQKKAGDDAALWAEKKDYLIINEQELHSQLIPKYPHEEVMIVMCEQQTFAQNKAKFYGLSEEALKKSYQNRVKNLEEQYTQKKLNLEQLEDKKAQAEDDFQRAMKNLDETAERYARIHLGRADEALKVAMRHFEQGNLDQALAAIDDNKLSLRSSEIKAETKRLQNTGDELADRRRNLTQKKQQYFDVLWLKADLYKLRYEWEKVEQCYVWGVELDSLNLENTFKYALYLQNQNQYHRAEPFCQTALKLCKTDYGRAIILNNLGVLLKANNEMSAAKTHYEEALKTFRQLAAKNPDAYQPDVAMTLNNLGALLQSNNEMSAAKTHYEEALQTYRQLAAKNPDAYQPNVAMTLYVLGALLQRNNEMSAAKTHFEEALQIQRQLAAKNPDAYNLDICQTSISFAIFYYQQFTTTPKDTTLKTKGLKLLTDARQRLQKFGQHPTAQQYMTALSELKAKFENPQATVATNSKADNGTLSFFNALTYIFRQTIQADSLAAAQQYPESITVCKEIIQEHHLIDSLMQIPEMGQLIAEKGITRKAMLQTWASRYGFLSYYHLHARQYPEAEQSARKGLEIDSTQTWINTNLALALVLQGKYAQAEIIYQQLKGKTELITGKRYNIFFLEGITNLEKAGITHKDFAKVRELLK